jgi:hypothetical protein
MDTTVQRVAALTSPATFSRGRVSELGFGSTKLITDIRSSGQTADDTAVSLAS